MQVMVGVAFAGGQQRLEVEHVYIEHCRVALHGLARNGKEGLAKAGRLFIECLLQPVEGLAQILHRSLIWHFRPEQGRQRMALVRPFPFQRQVYQQCLNFVGAEVQGGTVFNSHGGCAQEG
jgi:hypothetical protein